MTNPVAFHDQILQYIKSDSFVTAVDGEISFLILAKEFENYWRAIISNEIRINLPAIEHEENLQLPKPFKKKILLSVWSIND
jgi:ABC-type Fe2+-enterobactin transport system substrate-binding protein